MKQRSSAKKTLRTPARSRAPVRRAVIDSIHAKGLRKDNLTEEERWSQDVATLRRAAEERVKRRREPQNGSSSRPVDSGFDQVSKLLNDPSPEVRKKAVRDLYELKPDQAATLVNDALRDGSTEERRRIGVALADSGLLYEAIDDLMAENHERCYGAFSLLFLVAKAGVVQPLISVLEKHSSLDLTLALIRLMASSREPDVISAFQRLAGNSNLALEVRSAAAEALNG